MPLLLAPFNNAMRLGQGFNSYSQEICVDDAVVVDPNRAENVVTNDGTTMRIIAQNSAKPSAWNRQREVILDNRAEDVINRSRLLKPKDEVADVPSDEDAGDEEEEEEQEKEKEEEEEETEEKEEDETSADKKPDPKPGKPKPAKDPKEEPDSKDAKPGKEEDTSEDKDAGKSDTDSVEEIEHTELDKDDDAPPSKKEKDSGKPQKSVAKPGARDDSHPSKDTPADRPKPKLSLAQIRANIKKQKELDALEAQKEKHEIETEEKARLAEQRKYRLELEKEARDEERARRDEERQEQEKIRAEKRQWDQERREENRKAIKEAADLKALSLQDLEKIKAQNQFADRFTGMVEEQKNFNFDITAPRGPSQTVTYSSKFVDKLSDVTEDMCISGSLSIKAGKIGGSGKGSFVDSDKFKQSDLNFFISVKVVNQTQNFKDALIFNPLRSVDGKNFREVYGDSYISGFLEGGEFNAIVSMKILNKAKMQDIKAEAKVALTAGPLDITAEANVGIARSNIETNTETTIQVSWSGGGHIKPPEQQWDIQSLMQAAARFPDLVAECPQRTYAILTKYDTLRSFVARKPAGFTPLQYENAQIYTSALLDSFMTYKAMYKKIGEDIFAVQGKQLEIEQWETIEQDDVEGRKVVPASQSKAIASQPAASALKPSDAAASKSPAEDLTRFEASLRGLSDARKEVRRQMMYIVNEVDLVEKDPKTATDEDHQEPFQSPVSFEMRIPHAVIPTRLRTKTQPLTGKRIMAKTQTDKELQEEAEREEELANATPLYAAEDALLPREKLALDQILERKPGMGGIMRVTSGIGGTEKGKPFNNLDFVEPDWQVKSVGVEIARGAIAAVEVWYENGLHLKKGKSVNGRKKELGNFQPGERITFASIEQGVPAGGKEDDVRILAVRLYTNRGRRLAAQAASNSEKGPGKIEKDGVLYERVGSVYFDSPLSNGTVKGFFGSAEEPETDNGAIIRLGLVWGDIDNGATKIGGDADAAGHSYDYVGQADNNDIQDRMNDLVRKEQELATARKEATDYRTKAEALQSKVDAAQRAESERLDPYNNLTSNYENARVFLVSRTANTVSALDAGPDRGVHGWNYSFKNLNGNQRMTLRKEKPGNPKSSWVIEFDKTYVGFIDEGNGSRNYRSSRDSSSGRQEWFIGADPQDSGTFLIRNCYYGRYLTMRNPEKEDGRAVELSERDEANPGQKFHLFMAD